ncbi:hypothetical protein KIPB_013851, partial [Kipferlia bialata]
TMTLFAAEPIPVTRATLSLIGVEAVSFMSSVEVMRPFQRFHLVLHENTDLFSDIEAVHGRKLVPPGAHSFAFSGYLPPEVCA